MAKIVLLAGCCWVLSSVAALAHSDADALEELPAGAGMAVEVQPPAADPATRERPADRAARPMLRHLDPETSLAAADARERAIGAAVRALLQSQVW